MFNDPHSDLSEHCRPLAEPGFWTTLLAASLVAGILVSYIPQHAKIISRRSSEGLSPWWVLLGGLSSIAAIGNILTIPTSREDMACCSELGDGQCAAALLGVLQIGVQWTCFMLIVMLYLIFFPQSSSDVEDLSSSTASLTKSDPVNRRDPMIVGSLIFVSLFIVAVISIILVFKYPEHTQFWADILGTTAGVLAAIQYLPQIYYTWVIHDLKSLSITTIVIQSPGAFVFALSLGLRVGWGGWSTWLVYIVTGLLQAVLLVMGLQFWYEEGQRKREAAAAAAQQRQAEAEEDFGAVVRGHVNRRVSSSNIRQVDGVDEAAEARADERTALLHNKGQVRLRHENHSGN